MSSAPNNNMMNLSCKRCRVRKLKCTRVNPCANCAAAGEDCVFMNQDRRKKPVSHQYVEALEKQVASLQSALSRVRLMLPAEALEGLGLPEPDDPEDLSKTVIEANSKPEDRPDTTPHFRRTADGYLSYHGRTSIYQSEPNGCDIGVPELFRQSSSNLEGWTVQHDSSVSTAIRLFFRWQYPNFMFVYREAFLLDYLSDTFNGRYCSTALIYAVCALGAKMSQDPSISSLATDFRVKAHDDLVPSQYSTPQITTVQTLLCLAFAELGEGDVARAWLYSGMAFRLCQNAGLQREIRSTPHPDPSSDVSLDLEIRRRVYWGCYVADSVMSLLLGRPVFFDHEDASVQLSEPLPDMPFVVDWVETEFASFQTTTMVPYLRAVSELSRITHDLVSRICSSEGNYSKRQKKVPDLHQLDTKLCAWLDQLPEGLRWNRWHSSSSTLYPHVASLYFMAFSVRLCLYEEYTVLAPTDDFAQTSRSVRDTLVTNICRLVLHFKTQHGLRFAPITMVYAIAMCLHIMARAKRAPATDITYEDTTCESVLSKYLLECGIVFKIAADTNAQLWQSSQTDQEPETGVSNQSPVDTSSGDIGTRPLLDADILQGGFMELDASWNAGSILPPAMSDQPLELDQLWHTYTRFKLGDLQTQEDYQHSGVDDLDLLQWQEEDNNDI